jgi:hypothetical protein
MEPTKLNSSQSEETRIADWLRQDAAALADAGFSAQVIANLPPRRKKPSIIRQWAWPTLGALAGLAVALTFGSTDFSALSSLNEEISLGSMLLANTTAVAVIGFGALVIGLGFFEAFES